MKTLITIALFVFPVILYGQDRTLEFDGHAWKPPYYFPIPKGWTIERFLIPISFAPQISYKGVEDIRFTPGWGKANSDEYWSYAFLWYLDGYITISSEIIESNLKIYYTGLINSNGISKEKTTPVVTSFQEQKKESGDLLTYSGTISMTDYMSKKPILLHCKVHVKRCEDENKTILFYELSPQSLTHAIWQNLNQLRIEFKCKTDG